jgi:hypothetical protein
MGAFANFRRGGAIRSLEPHAAEATEADATSVPKDRSMRSIVTKVSHTLTRRSANVATQPPSKLCRHQVQPLPQVIAEAHFGQTGSGPVRPSAKEVREIIETHAEKIIDAVHDNSRVDITPLIKLYAEDFGEAAAHRLEGYCRRQVTAEHRSR